MAVVNPDRDRHLRSPRPARPGRRSARAHRSAGPRTAGGIRRIRPRRSFLRVPLPAIIGVELLATAWLAAVGNDRPAWRLAAGTVALAGVLLLVAAGGTSPTASAARRAGFAGRVKVTTARSDPNTDPHTDPNTMTPAALRAVFPGLVLRTAHDHTGHPFAVAEWAGTATVILAVTLPGGPLVHPRTVTRLPLGAIHDRVASTGIPVEAVTVTSVLPGAARPASADQPGAGRGALHRTDLLSLRLRPLSARSAIAIRGGGRTGLDATLAALVSLVRVTIHESGLAADPLDVEPASVALRSVLEPGGAHAVDGSEQTWVEAWSEITGPTTVQSCAAVTSWDPADPPHPELTDLETTAPLPDRVLVTELVPNVSGPPVARIVLRAVAAPGASARRARRTASDAARRAGLRFRVAAGEQLAALRSSTPLGPGTPRPEPRDAPAGSLVQGGLAIPPRLVDSLGPRLSRGIPFGTADTGQEIDIDIVGPRPRRIVAVGYGWLASEIAARAAATGVPVVVVTDRPAPWLAMARSAGVTDRVSVVADARSVDHAPAGGSGLVVVDGTSITAATSQGRWRTTLHFALRAEAVPPELARAADLVLVAPGAGDDPQPMATALHLDSEVAARAARLAGTDFLAVSRGCAITAQLEPRTVHGPVAPAQSRRYP